jgi:hypothetical protein
LNCVTVAVARGEVPISELISAFHLRARVDDGDGSDGDWNFRGTSAAVGEWLERLADRVGAVGLAGIAAARLVHETAALPIGHALFIESLTYSMLQAGPIHQQWLQQRRA